MPTYAEKTRSTHRSNPPRQPVVHTVPADSESAAVPAAGPTQRATAEQAAPVVSHWAESGRHSTQVRPAPAAKQAPDPGFTKLITPGLHEKDAPRRIALPAALTRGLQAAWERSYPAGQPIEQGGNLVQNQDGSFAFRHGKPGTDENYNYDLNDIDDGQRLLGVGHTHPYKKELDGPTDLSFSGEDLAQVLFVASPLVIAQSNRSRFIVARSAELEEQIYSVSYDQLQELARRIRSTWQSVFDSSKGSVGERADAATQITCRAFHMIYYRGKGSTLKRVDSHSQAEAGHAP